MKGNMLLPVIGNTLHIFGKMFQTYLQQNIV